MMRWLLWLLAGTLLGGIVHLVAVLILPSTATQDAYSRLAPMAPVNAVATVPQPVPQNEVMPFMDPAFASAVCRYDLTEGPIKLTVPVSLAYTPDSRWRNRDQFISGREEIVRFFTAKWKRELDYVLRKSLWGFRANRIAVRFQYECHDAAGQWWRCYGNELWEFDEQGLMRHREASINDVPIDKCERRIFGPRPDEERGREFPLR